MNEKQAINALKKYCDECIQCGMCLTVCSMLEQLGDTPGEIAQALLDGNLSEDMLRAIQRCSLCGLCSQECLVNLAPNEMMVVARELLLKRGLVSENEYDALLVDRDWNFFSIYRDTYGIQYDDLRAGNYETLFFPGCTLASYAPELTRKVYEWLADKGYRLGFTEMCCGKPLASIGLGDRKVRMLDELHDQMRAAGARRLITCCPNCHHLLGEQFKDIEMISLYDLLLEDDVRLSGETRLTVHDSCADRYSTHTGTSIREMLTGYEVVEMEHHGKHTICCGSGGIVSMIDADLCQERAETRITEFRQSGAGSCVTACMACSHRLARAALPGNVVHFLELVFDMPVDYEQVQANIQAMWEGEWGEYNLYRLSQAKVLPHVIEASREET